MIKLVNESILALSSYFIIYSSIHFLISCQNLSRTSGKSHDFIGKELNKPQLQLQGFKPPTAGIEVEFEVEVEI